jgi:hypothetical protein
MRALARTFRETEDHPLSILERGRMELSKQPGSSGDNALPQVQSVVAALGTRHGRRVLIARLI